MASELIADLATVGTARGVVAFMGIFVLSYWTFERFTGQDADPSLTYQKESDTGTMSVLFSGTKAIAAVGLVVAIALFPEIASGNWILIGFLAGVLVLHWYVEKEERE